MPKYFRLVVLATLLTGCIDRLLEGTIPYDGTIAVAVPSPALTVSQGSEHVFTATVTRKGELRGDVAVTIDGLPSGVSAVVGSPAISGLLTSASVTIRVAPGTRTGEYVITVRAHAEPSANATTLLLLTVTEPPSFALSVSAPTLTVLRGGVAPLAVTLARTNFTSPIALALSGNAGITADLSPNPALAGTSAGTINVAAAVAAGTYAVSLRGTGAGVADQTVALSVVVTSDAIQVIAPTRLVATQGSTLTAPVVVNRASYSGTVSLSAESLPNGVTAAFDPAAPAGGTSTMSLVVGPTTPAGTHRLRLRGTGTGVPDATTELELVVTAVTVGIAVDPAEVSVFQGGSSATATARLTRSTFTGPVTLTVSGAPAGLVVTPQPASVTGDSARVTIAASESAAPGQYTVSLVATPAGFPGSASRSAQLAVTIRSAPPGGGNVLLDWSQCAAPNWVAYQDGTGSWSQATVASGIARFTISATRGGIAYVEGGGTVTVRYGLQDEFIAKPLDMCPPKQGTKTIVGFSSLSATLDQFTYRLGGASATSTGASPGISFPGVSDGVHDLVGWGLLNVFGRRGIIRRDVDLPSGGSLGVVDALSSEGFIPVTAGLTVNGFLGGEIFSQSMNYLTTAACTPNLLYQQVGGSMNGVPSAMQRESDYHQLIAAATIGSRQRSVSVSFHTMSNRTVTLPALPTTPFVSVPLGGGSAGYKRLQVFVNGLSTVFNGSFGFRYNDGSLRSMSILASPGYAGTTNFVLTMPDFSGVSGWFNSYAVGPSASGTWVLSMDGATPGPTCSEGKTSVLMTQSGTYQ